MVRIYFRIVERYTSPPLDYKQHIAAFLMVPLAPHLGWRGHELATVLPLRKLISDADKFIDLTDLQHVAIAERFNNGVYADDSQDVLDMISYINTGEPADERAQTEQSNSHESQGPSRRWLKPELR